MTYNSQTDLSQFLRNTLSGASETPQIATDALVLPIGKRTSLSRARDQINSTFDLIEKSFKKIIDLDGVSNNTSKKSYQYLNNVAEKPTKNKKEIAKRFVNKHAKLLGVIVGGLLGMGTNYITQAMDSVVDTTKSIVKNASEWLKGKKDNLLSWAKKGYGYLSKTVKSTFESTKDYFEKTYDSVKNALNDNLGIVSASAETWSDEAKKSLAGLDVTKYDTHIDDAKIPEGAIGNIVGAIKRFWSNMLTSVRNWLFSIFGGDQQPLDINGTGSAGAAPVVSGNADYGSSAGIDSAGNIVSGGSQRNAGVTSSNGNVPSPADVKNLKGDYKTKIGSAMFYMRDQLIKEGVPPEKASAAAAMLVGQAMSESGLRPNISHDQGTGYGIYGARLVRRDKMLNWLADNGYAKDSLEGQTRYMGHEAMTDKHYAITKQALMNADPSNMVGNTDAVTGNFESPAIINQRSGNVSQAYGVGPVDPSEKNPNNVPPSPPPKTNDAMGNIGDASPMSDTVPIVPMTPLAKPPDDVQTSLSSPNSDGSTTVINNGSNSGPRMSPLGEVMNYTRKVPDGSSTY